MKISVIVTAYYRRENLHRCAVDLEVYHQWHQQTLAQTKPELARREFIRRKLKGMEEGEWRYPDGSTA